MTRYPFIWPLAGLVLGLGAGALWQVPLAVLLCLLGIACLAAVVWPRAWLSRTALCVVLGMIRIDQTPPPVLPPSAVADGEITARAIVTEWLSAERIGVQLAYQKGTLPVLLTRPDGYRPFPGDVLSVAVRLREPPDAVYPGGFNYQRYLQRHGYACAARPVRWERLRCGPPSLQGVLWCARAAVRDKLARYLPSYHGEAVGMLFGDKSGLDPQVARDLQIAGLGHLLAISGLHVGIIAVLTGGLLTPLPHRMKTLGIMGTVAAYAVLVGFRASVVRAAVMVMVLCLPRLMGRPPQPLHAVSLAAVAVLLAAPAALFSPGLQLSFIIAFFLIWGIENHPLLRRKWWGGIVLAAVAQAAALPLLVRYFHFWPPMSIVINIFLLPTFPWLLGWLLVLLASPWTLLSRAAAGLFVMQADGMRWLAQCGEEYGIRHVNVAPPSPLWMGVYYLVLLLGCWAGLRRAWRCPLLFVYIGVVCLPLVNSPAPGIDFLDVDQGDAILIRSAAYRGMVDAGPASAGYKLQPQLRSRGINHLDWLILTHPHEDHAGGAGQLLREIPVDQVILGCGPSADVTREYEHFLAGYAGEKVLLGPGEILTLAAGQVTVARLPDVSGNDASLVTRIAWDTDYLLLTGDIEEAGIEKILLTGLALPSAIMKLPHHGSFSPRLAELLRRVAPKYAIITAARYNRFGLPHRKTLQLLAQYDLPWLQTGYAGMITVNNTASGPQAVADPPYPW